MRRFCGRFYVPLAFAVSLLLCSAPAMMPSSAQKTRPVVVYQTGAPTGTCSEKIVVDRATGKEYVCVANSWTEVAGGGGGGISSLGGQTGGAQSFADSDDSNVTLSIGSASDTHTFALGWAGALAKSRQHAATVYGDAGNTFSAGAQDFGAASSFKAPVGAGLAPTTSGLFGYDSTANVFKGGANGSSKTFAFTDSSITGNAATATALAANPADCGSNQFANAVAASGDLTCAQPAASNLSNGTTGSGAVVLANAPTFTATPVIPVPTFTSPTLGTSWVYWGSGAQAGYTKTAGGLVVLKGLIKGGAASSTIWTLPAGYRPSELALFRCVYANTTARVDVQADGQIIATGYADPAQLVDLSCIRFIAEQ